MEKRISFYEFQSAKSVAKAIDPIVRKKDRVKAQIEALLEEYKSYNSQIEALEAGIVQVLGFHVTDLVKKVIEPDKNGNKVTKYLPTSIVSYDEEKKQYVISVPEAPATEAPQTEEEAASFQETVVPPTTADGPGSDYNIDAREDNTGMPF